MYPFLTNVSIAFNLNKKQHAMFMLMGRMFFNSYDNHTPIEPFFTWLSGYARISKSHVV
jgi:hypothetical protein